MGNTNGVDIHNTEVPKINDLFNYDSYLKPYEKEIRRRYGCFKQQLDIIDTHEQGLLNFTESYKQYGYHVDAQNNVNFLEWAPAAKNIYIRGDFSKLFFFLINHFIKEKIFDRNFYFIEKIRRMASS